MSSLNTISPSTASQTRTLSEPADGTLEVKGPFGRSVLLLELSGDMNSAHIETKIGQKQYTIDIRPTLGKDSTGGATVETFTGSYKRR